MFFISFLIFIFVFTIFENISLAIIALALIAISVVIYQVVSRNKIIRRQFALDVGLAFVLASIAFGVKERRYGWYTNPPSFPLPASEDFTPFALSRGTFVGTGIIVDTPGQGKYVFAVAGDEYLLRSEKTYAIGDVIRLVGQLDSGRNTGPTQFCWAGCRNEVRSKYRSITSSTFDVPIFSGDFDYAKWLKMKGRKGTIMETNGLILLQDTITKPSDEIGISTEQTGFRPQHLTHAVLLGMLPEGGRGGYEDIRSDSSDLGVFARLKLIVQQQITRAYGQNKVSGLILGMVIGDKSQIPQSEYQGFIDSGLVHLVAVSGGNILMLVVFLHMLLFFLPFYMRLGVIILAIIGYGLLCGMDSSVFRAVIMGGMSMIALFRGREIDVRRLMSMSAVVMLMINPYFLAYDTGFLLSYSALIGIVYLTTVTSDEGPVTRKGHNVSKNAWSYLYKSYLQPSIGASIGIFPIIIFFMGKVNLVSVIGNVFVLPVVPFVMIYGYVSAWLFLIFRRNRIVILGKFMIARIYKISQLTATYGLYLSVSGLWIKYLILLSFIITFVVRRRKCQGKESKPASHDQEMKNYTGKAVNVAQRLRGKK